MSIRRDTDIQSFLNSDAYILLSASACNSSVNRWIIAFRPKQLATTSPCVLMMPTGPSWVPAKPPNRSSAICERFSRVRISLLRDEIAASQCLRASKPNRH